MRSEAMRRGFNSWIVLVKDTNENFRSIGDMLEKCCISPVITWTKRRPSPCAIFSTTWAMFVFEVVTVVANSRPAFFIWEVLLELREDLALTTTEVEPIDLACGRIRQQLPQQRYCSMVL